MANSKDPKPATRPGKNGGTLKNGAGPGRPKGSLSLIGQIRRELEANDEASAKMLAKALIMQAAKGNAQAIKQIFDRIDGPVAQRIEIDDVSQLDDDALHARTAAAFRGVRPQGDSSAVRDPAADA